MTVFNDEKPSTSRAAADPTSGEGSVSSRAVTGASRANGTSPDTDREAAGTSGYAVPSRNTFRLGENVPATDAASIAQSGASADNERPHEWRSPTPSLYTLDQELRKYIKQRESTAYQYYPGTERVNYDYSEERTQMYSTNIVESTAHLIKGSIGAGVLSMHEAYMYGGLWTSLVVNFVIGILLYYLVAMLVRSARLMYGRLRINKLSYPDLAEAAAATSPWGWVRKHCKVFRYTVDTCLLLNMCGTCCIYQIMIAHTLRQVLEGVHSPATEVLGNIRMYILMSIPGLLLLVLIRNLKFLAPFTMLGDFFIGLCVMTTLYYSLRTMKVGITERPAWKNPHGLVRFCGICMYCTSGICVALPVENNMTYPRYFNTALQFAMLSVTLLASMTGFFGYWTWGEACKSPITVHMPLNTFTTILQFLLVMMLSTTYAVQFWVPFRIVWHYIEKYSKYKRKSAIWERLYRVVLVTMLTGVTMAFPNLIPVMIFMGQFFLGFVAIIFPACIECAIYWQADTERKNWWRVSKNFILIILGLLLSGSSFYSVREED